MKHVHCSVLFLSLIFYGSSCSIIKPSFSCFTVNSQSGKFILCSLCLFTVAIRHHIFYICHYKQKYLSRRIPYASNGSFNPYIITNKEAHMVNGNPAVPKDSNCHKCLQTLKPQLKKSFPEEVSEPLCLSGIPPVQMHFRNHCLDFPGKFSCAIDCFLELSCYIFKDAIACVERNEFFEMLYTACVQVNSGEIFVHQLGLVREPVWAWMRWCCPSFTDMSANAVFSDIFQVNTFRELTSDLKALFLFQHTNHSICSQCNQQITKSTDVVVLYITHQHIHQNSFESSVSEAMLPNINELFCVHCQNHSGSVALLRHFVSLPTFLMIESSSDCIT